MYLTLYKQEAYFAVMAALGITYGLQVANILGAAQELVGAADMPIVLGFELFMQGVGGLIGGPIAGKEIWFICILLVSHK